MSTERCVCGHPDYEHGDGSGERWPCSECMCSEYEVEPDDATEAPDDL